MNNELEEHEKLMKSIILINDRIIKKKDFSEETIIDYISDVHSISRECLRLHEVLYEKYKMTRRTNIINIFCTLLFILLFILDFISITK